MSKKIKLKISSRLLKKKFRKSTLTAKKHCRFCGNPEQQILLDYKNSIFLKHFLTERGKILPSRISGTCNEHQHKLANAIKKARTIALLPYVTK
ncbi:30S ribosomal protein S18 [Candidatus Dependentiae bacterium]|nr:MAG: 30S ribosomal protein S18 [Candidatus Dependentiae bacterium]